MFACLFVCLSLCFPILFWKWLHHQLFTDGRYTIDIKEIDLKLFPAPLYLEILICGKELKDLSFIFHLYGHNALSSSICTRTKPVWNKALLKKMHIELNLDILA